jgi:tetratricopeptide (TPR) repeat protein
MAGAFDFYVDESLLEQLLGGGDSSKAKKDGKAKPVPTPAPVAPAPAPAPKAIEIAPVAPAEPVPAPVAIPVPAPDPVVETAPVPARDPVVEAWLEGDRYFAEGQFASAAAAYVQAANLVDSGDAARRSTLFCNAGLAWLRVNEFNPAVEVLSQAATADPQSRPVRFALALAFLRLNQPQYAVLQFEPLLADTPSDPDALLGKMQALCALGDFEQANAVSEQFREHHPGNAAGLEAALSIRAALQDRDGVEQAAKDLLALDAGSTTALKVLAAVAIARQDFAAAVNYFDVLTASERNPDFDTLIHAAAAYQANGQFDRAARTAHKALDLQPDSFEAANRLAEVQHKQDAWQDALASYRKAIELNPECPETLWNLALVQERLGSIDDATDSLTAAVRIRTDWQDASMRLAVLHLEAGRFQEGAAVLEHCLMLRNDWPEALFRLGTAFHRMGQPGPAQEAVLKALELKPDETAWIEYLEQIAVERNDALVALDCHERLAEASIESPEMAYNLGVVLQNENEPELAAKCYVRALEKKPDFGLAMLNLGHALQDLGREDEARACWSKAVLLDPELAAGYFSV